MKTKTLAFAGLAALAAIVIGACSELNDADQAQQARIEQQQMEAERVVGPPAVTSFTELRNAVTIMERRDEALATYSYYMDLTGELHFLCESIGYGLPYSVQTTNPDRLGYKSSYGVAVLPQAEPNGMFMPDNVAATWILCATDTGFDAVYWEPDLVVSPFPLAAVSNLRAGE